MPKVIFLHYVCQYYSFILCKLTPYVRKQALKEAKRFDAIWVCWKNFDRKWFSKLFTVTKLSKRVLETLINGIIWSKRWYFVMVHFAENTTEPIKWSMIIDLHASVLDCLHLSKQYENSVAAARTHMEIMWVYGRLKNYWKQRCSCLRKYQQINISGISYYPYVKFICIHAT